MGRAERVVFALGALGEAGKPVLLAQRADAVAPPGEDLVRIGLVADIPDQPVVGRVEHVVQRHGQFDHAEPGAEMAAGLGNGVDQLGAQLLGNLRQFVFRQLAQVGRKADAVEQRCLWRRIHGLVTWLGHSPYQIGCEGAEVNAQRGGMWAFSPPAAG